MMSEPKYQIGGNDAVCCIVCNCLLDDLSQFNFCFECWSDYKEDIMDEDDVDEDFVPTEWPISTKCYPSKNPGD
jgi:hypothetical protein